MTTADGDIQDLLIKLSSDDSSSLDDLLSSSSTTKIFSSLAPFLFNPDYNTIAHTILTTILQKKPTLLPAASSSIHNHITQKLAPSDEFVVSEQLLRLMVQQLQMVDTDPRLHNSNSSSSTSIATQSIQALQTLCTIRPPLVQTLLSILKNIPKDSTIMIRYYTLILQIIPELNSDCSMNDEDDDGNDGTEIWKPLMDGLRDENDPLLQMSILELLEVMDRDDLIQDWKELDPIMLRMVGMNIDTEDYDQDEPMDGTTRKFKVSSLPLHPFCAGAALRILAKRNIPLDLYRHVLLSFGRKMSGEVEKIGFVDGISTYICCQRNENNASNALKAILGERELLEEWLNLRMGQSKLKVVVMNSISTVLLSNFVQEEEGQSLCMALYQSIGDINDVGAGHSTTEIIMEYVKSQLVELRLGVYELLTAVAKNDKGAHELMRYGGFFEFLCNRNLEIVKEGKELKFDLVKSIVHSKVIGLLASEVVEKLDQVIEDGPYYVKDNRHVALSD